MWFEFAFSTLHVPESHYKELQAMCGFQKALPHASKKIDFFPKKQVANSNSLRSPVRFQVEKLDCRIYHLEHQGNFVLIGACLKGLF